jgi:hypothetical protein
VTCSSGRVVGLVRRGVNRSPAAGGCPFDTLALMDQLSSLEWDAQLAGSTATYCPLPGTELAR